jgi:hypothetical protein
VVLPASRSIVPSVIVDCLPSSPTFRSRFNCNRQGAWKPGFCTDLPLEGPPIASVPRGLRARHFNDELLHLIRAEEIELERREREKGKVREPKARGISRATRINRYG